MKSLSIAAILSVFFLLATPANVLAQPGGAEYQEKVYNIFDGNAWADSVLKQMTHEEKIGQLFMVAAYSNKDQKHVNEILGLVKDYHIGGLIFFQGTPRKQALLTNLYQSKAKVPLLMAMDAEWGLAMRLDSTISFPRQMTLGALQDDSLIYTLGRDMGTQLRRLGVHVSFSPVADINNNPLNPVIHTRSFGEDKAGVAKKSAAYMRGLQDENVLAVVKHFPGHGDTEVDSHHDLPVIKNDRKRLDTLELVPFNYCFRKGAGGVMVAHIDMPELERKKNTPSTLSEKIVTKLLKDDLNFKGLIFTDAMNMQGVAKYYDPGEAELKALLAGNDILLFPREVPKAVALIKEALDKGRIGQQELDEKVHKILATKYWTGAYKRDSVKIAGLMNDLHKPGFYLHNRQMAEQALTLVQDNDKQVPIKNLATTRIAAVSIGANSKNIFQQRLGNYAKTTNFQLAKNASAADYKKVHKSLEEFDLVLVSLHGISRYNLKDFGINNDAVAFIDSLGRSKKVVLTVFGTPYSLKLFENVPAILLAYEDEDHFADAAAQALFGGIPITGKLPVSVGRTFDVGQGIKHTSAIRLKYTVPEEVGINSTKLAARIDSVMNIALREKATPGAQVLVAKNGRVIFQRSYGYHTYQTNKPVTNTDIYDLASITKISASTIALMKLYEQGQIHPDSTLQVYLKKLENTNKGKLKMREILAHQAGLVAWIPFYRYTLTDGFLCDTIYCYEPENFFTTRINEHLYIRDDWQHQIWQAIYDSPVKNPGNYLYSDLGFFFMKRIIDSLTLLPFDQYLDKTFYSPLGMHTATFNPLDKFSKDMIVPTEKDNSFRNTLVHGHVHDQAAAMLGGVAGHAGMFSSANDLAILMQMLLNKGTYGGERYFNPATIDTFTAKQYAGNRKGMGFDKAEMRPKFIGPTTRLASAKTFGHSGFTGTGVWADPEHDLVYVFLSNRVHPSAENKKLVTLGTRTEIQKVIYESFLVPANVAQGAD